MPQSRIRRYMRHGRCRSSPCSRRARGCRASPAPREELHLAQPTVSSQIASSPRRSAPRCSSRSAATSASPRRAAARYAHCLEVLAALRAPRRCACELREVRRGELRLAIAGAATVLRRRGWWRPSARRTPTSRSRVRIDNRDEPARRLPAREDDLYLFANAPDDGGIVRQAILANPLVVVAPRAPPLDARAEHHAGRARAPAAACCAKRARGRAPACSICSRAPGVDARRRAWSSPPTTRSAARWRKARGWACFRAHTLCAGHGGGRAGRARRGRLPACAALALRLSGAKAGCRRRRRRSCATSARRRRRRSTPPAERRRVGAAVLPRAHHGLGDGGEHGVVLADRGRSSTWTSGWRCRTAATAAGRSCAHVTALPQEDRHDA